MIARLLIRMLCLVLLAGPALAQTKLSAQARLDPVASSVRDMFLGGVEVRLTLTQGVPYRIYTLDAPRRLVIDFNVVEFADLDTAALNQSADITDIQYATMQNGWSQLVLFLARPLQVTEAGMTIDPQTSGATLRLSLGKTTAEKFGATAGPPNAQMIAQLPALGNAAPDRRQDERFVIVLDPGHGGIDPGAESHGVEEADLMLSLARRLRDVLRRSDLVEVVLTRNDDVFVSLEQRISIAHAAQADVFISLHADKVIEGNAQGATLYTLSETATDQASEKLAQRHDRAEIISGVDLSQSDDEVAGILLDLARQDTQPRSELLAQKLVDALQASVGTIQTHPHRRADFSVLKAADIPSVLIEAGYMSSDKDLQNLAAPEWQDAFAKAVVQGILDWYIADQALAPLRRQ